MKIKKIIWIYRAIVVAIFLAILCRDPELGGTILASVWASEFSIGLWMARGWPPFMATMISIGIGDFIAFNVWMIIFYDLDRWLLVRRVVGAFWKLSPTEMDLQSWKYRLRYIAIPPLSCFFPLGSVWISLIAAKFLRLHTWATLALVLVGNTVRLILCGEAFAVLTTNVFLKKNIGFVTTALFIGAVMSTVLTKTFRELRKREKELQRDMLLLKPSAFAPQELIALCFARALL